MHIHIVDDDPVIRTLITDYVRYLGHHATTSETGEQALILLKNSTPDILLLDFQLPDVTGAEVMNVLLERSRYYSVRSIQSASLALPRTRVFVCSPRRYAVP